jgi:hypothetical protein
MECLQSIVSGGVCGAQAKHAAFEYLDTSAQQEDDGSSASSSDLFNERPSGSASSAEDSSLRMATVANATSSHPSSPPVLPGRPQPSQASSHVT